MPREYKRVLAAEAAARAEDGTAGSPSSWERRVMGKPTGFIELKRRSSRRRPVEERLHDWREVYKLPRRRCSPIRARAAWTAASRSAIRAARSAT